MSNGKIRTSELLGSPNAQNLMGFFRSYMLRYRQWTLDEIRSRLSYPYKRQKYRWTDSLEKFIGAIVANGQSSDLCSKPLW